MGLIGFLVGLTGFSVVINSVVFTDSVLSFVTSDFSVDLLISLDTVWKVDSLTGISVASFTLNGSIVVSFAFASVTILLSSFTILLLIVVGSSDLLSIASVTVLSDVTGMIASVTGLMSLFVSVTLLVT